ncbi:hypothetical protein NL676_029596 [Syzygium grande]|nr:hypothetical protein NL676_029596 [Syzygium grande]
MDCDPKSQNVSPGDASTGNGSSHDTSDDMELRVSSERLKGADPDLADKSAESDVDHISSAPCKAEVEACKVEDKSMPALPFQVGVQSTTEDGYIDDSPEAEAGVAYAASICDSCAINGSQMCPLLSDVSHNKSGMDDKSMLDSCVAGDFQYSGCLTNANEEKGDILAENVTEGADGKSRDARSILQSEENLILVNSNADDQISYRKENVIEFDNDEELLSRADVKVENNSLLSFPSKGESLNETDWDSCGGSNQYDNADADVKVTLVEPIATSEERRETMEIWKEENAEDIPVSTVVSIQASKETEDLRKDDITVGKNCQDASVSEVNSVQINSESNCPTTEGEENNSSILHHCKFLLVSRAAAVACAFGAMGSSQSSVIMITDSARKTSSWYSSVPRSATTLDSSDVNSHSEGPRCNGKAFDVSGTIDSREREALDTYSGLVPLICRAVNRIKRRWGFGGSLSMKKRRCSLLSIRGGSESRASQS